MKILGVQFNKLSGPDATANYSITFTLDESQRFSLKNLLELKKGTELLMILFETATEETEITDIATENEDQLKKRFNRRMHAIINDIAKDKQKNAEEIKKILKKFLISKKYIKESSKELTIKGYAAAIYFLQNEFK